MRKIDYMNIAAYEVWEVDDEGQRVSMESTWDPEEFDLAHIEHYTRRAVNRTGMQHRIEYIKLIAEFIP